MSRIRATGTKPELAARRLMCSLGFSRYRLHVRHLPGCPDIVFTRLKKAIYVHGCFWHQHAPCSHYRQPQTRLDFWRPKLEGNQRRDKKNKNALRKQGWKVMVIWECELGRMGSLVAKIDKFMRRA